MPCAAPLPEPGGSSSEDEQERLNRNIAELLQELRVASLGVQVLFGFILAMPFYSRFKSTDAWERQLYLGVLLVAALAIMLLGGPVALHRILFRHHARAEVVRASNMMAIAGLLLVSLAVTGAVLLVARVVSRGTAAATVTSVVGACFGVTWFIVPVYLRLRAPRRTRGAP